MPTGAELGNLYTFLESSKIDLLNIQEGVVCAK